MVKALPRDATPLIKKYIKDHNIPILEETPYCLEEDAMIELAGDYKGIHFSIGDGYYSVVREMGESFLFVDGEGDIQKELQDAMSATPTIKNGHIH